MTNSLVIREGDMDEYLNDLVTVALVANTVRRNARFCRLPSSNYSYIFLHIAQSPFRDSPCPGNGNYVQRLKTQGCARSHYLRTPHPAKLPTFSKEGANHVVGWAGLREFS
jgi:hypothetical protein